MTELIKQRLVGLILVAIAGAIFLPDLLDGKKQLSKEEFKKIPPRPEIVEKPDLTEFPAQRVAEAMAQIPEPKDIVAADDKPSNTNVVAEPMDQEEKVDEQPTQSTFKESAWILQLGSFRHKENVDALVNKIHQAGFKTFIKPVETKAGVLSKVFIGPEIEKANLEKAQQKLKELTGLDGKVTEYTPID